MNMMVIPFAVLYALALLITFLTTPLARRIAIFFDAVDYPNARRINTQPIPRMGGIAILLGLIGATAVLRYVGPTLGWPVILVRQLSAKLDYRIIAVGFFVMFSVGVIDDVVDLKPIPKLVGQIFAATIAASGGLVIGHIVNPFGSGEINLGWLTYPVTVLYLVSYANIINLIDGLDGLATGISGIASATMAVLALLAGNFDAAALAIIIAGATLGFLPYNFNPASIFLGDCGSLLLGFSLGTISLLNVTRLAGLTTIIVPLVVAGIPIIDTLSSIVRRLRAHVSIGQADRGHIHHRLIAEGFNQRQAVLLIYAWTLMLCTGSLIMVQISLWPRVVLFICLLVMSFFFAQRLHLFEPVLRHHRGTPDSTADSSPSSSGELHDSESREDEPHKD